MLQLTLRWVVASSQERFHSSHVTASLKMVDGSNMYMLMKKIVTLIMVCAAAMFAFAACGDPEAEKLEKVVGEWHYTGVESGVQIDIYLGLYNDSTFDLYQKVGDGPHYLYKGKFSFDGQVLTGTYSDYTPWAHDYNVTKANGSLTLTSVASPGYSITFKKEAIPQSVRTHYMPVTKAEGETPAIL